jgi:hypothetical protein
MRNWILAAILLVGAPALAQSQIQVTPTNSLYPPARTERLSLPDSMVRQWHDGRRLYGVGSITGLVGSALSLSSVLVVIITGYPCDPNDPIHMINPNDSCNMAGIKYAPPKPTDAVPLLAYMGATTSALGFVLSTSGLGLQHHVLYEAGRDTGRGIFAGGASLGVLGFLSIGTSYFFGLTNYLDPHGQGIAILASSVTGMALCTLGGLLYTIDAGKMKKAWDRLGTF